MASLWGAIGRQWDNVSGAAQPAQGSTSSAEASPSAGIQSDEFGEPSLLVGGEDSAYGWFRAIPGPVGPDGQVSNCWEPLRQADARRLEAALHRRERPQTVLVEGGRAEVWLQERMLRDRYGTVPPKQPCALRRALWLRRTPEGRWEPYEEAADAQIEAAFQDLRTSAVAATATGPKQFSQTVPVGQVSVKLQLKLASGPADAHQQWEFTAEEKASAWTALLGKGAEVIRGCGQLGPRIGELEEEVLHDDLGHLFVLVHGTDESDVLDVDAFRQNLHRCQLMSAGYVQHASSGLWMFPAEKGKPPKVPKDEVIEINMASASTELYEQLQELTPGIVRDVREAVSCTVSHVLAFANKDRRAKAMADISERVAAGVTMFKGHNPGFSGQVVLIGCGIEAAYLFELLRAEKLPFAPTVLFALGSPLGALLSVGGAPLPPSYTLPGGTRLINAFHPRDISAYRVEPILCPDEVRRSAEKAPSDPGRLMQRILGCEGKETQIQGLLMNGGVRVDWMLPDEGGQVNVVSSAGYFDLPEVATFVQVTSRTFSNWDTPNALEDFLSSGAWNTSTAASESLQDKTAAFKDTVKSGAKDLLETSSRKLGETGKAVADSRAAEVVTRKARESGATEIVVGTYQAAAGVVGVARALGGTVRLVGGTVGAASGAVKLAASAVAEQKKR